LIFLGESLDTLHVERPKPIIDTNRDPCQGKENAYYLLSNGFGPYQPKNYDFPKRGGRKFRSECSKVHIFFLARI